MRKEYDFSKATKNPYFNKLEPETIKVIEEEAAEDELLKLAGFIDSGISDIAERHNFYIRQSLIDDHEDT